MYVLPPSSGRLIYLTKLLSQNEREQIDDCGLEIEK
jgi:hypothetical protein